MRKPTMTVRAFDWTEVEAYLKTKGVKDTRPLRDLWCDSGSFCNGCITSFPEADDEWDGEWDPPLKAIVDVLEAEGFAGKDVHVWW